MSFNKFLVFCLLLTQLQPVAAEKAVSFGILPFADQRQLEGAFDAARATLEDFLHRPVHIKTDISFAAYQKKAYDMAYDIVIVQPLDYVRLVDTYHWIPLGFTDTMVKGNLVVNPDERKIWRMEDINGKTLGLAEAPSAMSDIAAVELPAHGLKVTTLQTHSHFVCLRYLQLKRIDACLTSDVPLLLYESIHQIRFVTVASFPDLTPPVILMNPNMPKKDQETLLSYFSNGYPIKNVPDSYLARIGARRFLPMRSTDDILLRKIYERYVLKNGREIDK